MAIIGHASKDENGKYIGGKAGDQTGKEVCTREYYLHSKGWYLFRFKLDKYAVAIKDTMNQAVNNKYIGYDQGERLDIMTALKKYGSLAKISEPTECDCSSLVRACIYQATGIDLGNFTTGTEPSVLTNSGLFKNKVGVTTSTTLYDGDILVTKTKAHTVIVVSGKSRQVAKTKVTYTSHRIPTNKWGNEIVGYNLTNTMGYSGSFGKELDKVTIKLSEGTITYCSHRLNGGWGNEIHGYSKTDTNKYAGSTNKPIDAIAIKATGINGKLKYRVHRKTDNKWGNWITGYSKTDTNNYAGSFGKPIDAIQIGIE